MSLSQHGFDVFCSLTPRHIYTSGGRTDYAKFLSVWFRVCTKRVSLRLVWCLCSSDACGKGGCRSDDVVQSESTRALYGVRALCRHCTVYTRQELAPSNRFEDSLRRHRLPDPPLFPGTEIQGHPRFEDTGTQCLWFDLQRPGSRARPPNLGNPGQIQN